MPYRYVNGRIERVHYSKEDIIKIIKEQGIKFVDLQFTSLFGRFHHVTMASNVIDDDSLEHGFPKLDGSSVRGFTEIYESDLVLKPDLDTFAIIPWHEHSARLICNVYWGFDKGKFERDPRGIARKTEDHLKEQGFDIAYFGPEVEFFVFDNVTWHTSIDISSYAIESEEVDGSYPIKPKDGYMPSEPIDTLAEFRNECSNKLASFGIICEDHHHEVATAGQCELSMRFEHLTNAADNVMTYKYTIRNVARMFDLVATFMPKPLARDNGSGMHINISIWKGNSNAFYDENDNYAEISQIARYFIGGLLDHACSLASIAAPTTNSYRRLVPGFEAPVYIAWSRNNRSAIVRIPTYFKGKKHSSSKRLELRVADPSCNPYLCFAAVLCAGMDGIKKKIDAGDPVDEDIYKLDEHKRRALNIKQLPSSLDAAADALASDNDYLRQVFDNSIIEKIIEKAKNDSREVYSLPHPYEFSLYFDV